MNGEFKRQKENAKFRKPLRMRGEELFEATYDFSSPDARMWS
jgi:hypothetical protein